jgi:hypothetical protein
MPISPYNTPIMTEYKPLGLEAFAQPLSKMQEQFDATLNAANQMDFDLKHLPLGTDPERAKALLKIAEDKRNEIANNLLTSKNYRQAARQLMDLKNLWEKDPEKQVLESNYATYQEMVKRERDRVGKPEGMSQKQFNQWLAHLNDTYSNQQKGASFKASYDNPDGEYNTPSLQPRVADMTEKIRNLKLELAKMQPGEERESTLKSLGINMNIMDEHFRKTIIEEKDATKVAKAVEQFLRQQEDVNTFGKEEAFYNLTTLKRESPEGYQRTAAYLLSNQQKEINNQINAITQRAAKGDKNAIAYKNSEKFKQLTQEAEALNEMSSSGNIPEEYVNELYTEQHLNKLFSGKAAGDLVAYKNIKYEDVWRDVPMDKDNGPGGGKDPSLNGGIDALPGGDVKFDTKNLHEGLLEAKKGIYSTTTQINKISGGQLGGMILGQTKEEKEKMAKNPYANYQRAAIIRNAVVQAQGDFNTFKKIVKNNGIESTDRQMQYVFKDLSNPKSVAFKELNSHIENGAADVENYASKQAAYQSVKNEVFSRGKDRNTEFDVIFDQIGTQKPVNPISASDFADISEKVGDMKSKVGIFNAYNYPKEKLKKLGIVLNNDPKGPAFFALTANQVAKLKGFKDAKDAISKGYNFGGASFGTDYDASGKKIEKNTFFDGVSGDAQSIAGSLINYTGKKGISKQKMTWDIVGDEVMEDIMKKEFSDIGKVLQYAGKDGKGFAGQTGFDEKGNPEAGTEIKSDGKSRLTLHGGNVYFQLEIKTKDGDANITIQPQKGSKDFIIHHLNREIATIKKKGTDDKYNRTIVNEMQVAKFNQKFGNTFNNVSVNSGAYKTSKQKPRVVVGSFTQAASDGQPITMNVVKYLPIGASVGNEKYYITPAGSNITKPYSPEYETVEDLKADIGQSIYE